MRESGTFQCFSRLYSVVNPGITAPTFNPRWDTLQPASIRSRGKIAGQVRVDGYNEAVTFGNMRKDASVYVDIAESVRREVAGLPPGSRLSSEPELVKRYGAARGTVRQALAKLQSEGLIYSRRGAGSFVAEPRIEQDLDQLFSFGEFMNHRGLPHDSKLLLAERQRITIADSPIIESLALDPGDQVIYLRRLCLGRGEPLVIANTWLPSARFPGFLRRGPRERSVYELMQSMGLRPTEAVQTIEAAALDPLEAELLNDAPGSPTLLVRRIGYARGIPVEYSVYYYRGFRTRFRVRLVGTGGPGERATAASTPTAKRPKAI